MENKNMMMGNENFSDGLTEDMMTEFANLMQQSNELIDNFSLEDGEYRLVVNMINKSTNQKPTYANHGDSGFDLRANLPYGPVTIESGKIAIIPTGNFFEIPYGWELQVRSRSGMAAKHGVMVLNSPGTVDSSFRGEVMAILFNTGAVGDFDVNHGDRICQGVVTAVAHNVKLTEVEELSTTTRGDGKFGSSGIK